MCETQQVGYPTSTKPAERRNINTDRLPIYDNSDFVLGLSQQQRFGQEGVKFLVIMSTPQTEDRMKKGHYGVTKRKRKPRPIRNSKNEPNAFGTYFVGHHSSRIESEC